MRWTDSNEGQVFVFPLTVMQLKQRVNWLSDRMFEGESTAEITSTCRIVCVFLRLHIVHSVVHEKLLSFQKSSLPPPLLIPKHQMSCGEHEDALPSWHHVIGMHTYVYCTHVCISCDPRTPSLALILSWFSLPYQTLFPPLHLPLIDPKEPRMAFVGFVRPNVGAIPPMSEMQVCGCLCVCTYVRRCVTLYFMRVEVKVYWAARYTL